MRVWLVLVAVLAVSEAVAVSEGGVHWHRGKEARRKHHAARSHERDVQILTQTDEAAGASSPSPIKVDNTPVVPMATDATATADVAPTTKAPPPAAAPAPDMNPVAEAPKAASAAPAPANPQGSLLQCQTVDGKMICMPADGQKAEPVPAKVPLKNPAPAAEQDMGWTAGVVTQLREKAEFEESRANNAMEMAKEMVKEVRDETKKLVEEAESNAKMEHDENEELRKEIVALQERLQEYNASPKPAAAVMPTAATPAAAAVAAAVASAAGGEGETAAAAAKPTSPEELKKALEEYENLKKEYESM